MPDKVVDCSAVAAVLFGEPEGAIVAPQLNDARLFAPALFGFELGNTCVVKARKRPEDAVALAQMYANRRSLRIETIEIDFDAAVQLALATGLSAYDASYLLLARTIGADLVTLDKKLARAAAAS